MSSYLLKKMVTRCLLLLFVLAGITGHAFAKAAAAVVRITGKVTSSIDGAAMPGVNVLLKGTQTGTTTDASGSYSLDATDSEATLVFSYIGFNSIETKVGGRTVINVTLEEDVATLDEAVVTALGISRDKKSLGYGVTQVKGADIVNVPQENVVNALSGRVAGVAVNQTSGAGSSVSIVIRGAKSLSNDNQPLFVIDGVPVSNGLNNVRSMGDRNNVDYGNAISDINPDDVESMTVLKGPSAAALYGSRAGNGVILITTKSGKKGKGLGVSFSTSNVFEKPYEYLDLHYKYANGDRNNALSETSSYWGGPQLDVGNKAVQWNSPVGADGVKTPTELRSYKDNLKNFLQTGVTSTNNVAISGSNDKATFRVSYNLMNNKGLIPNSDLKKNALSANATYEASKKVKLSTNLNFVRSQSDNRPSTANRGANPLEAAYLFSHIDIRELKDYWKPGAEDVAQRAPTSADNPYFLAYGINNGFTRDRAFGNVKLDWQILPELSAFARVSHDVFMENRETKIPLSYSRVKNGGYYKQNFSRQETNTDFLITYKKNIQDIDFSVSGGGNIMRQSGNDMYTGGSTLTVPGLYRVSNIPIGAVTYTNGSDRKEIYSIYGTASVGYKNALYLDVTARNDWSSTLPRANRSYFYPSASLSWLANYTFKLPEQISLLKFRAGWAQVGNDAGAYQLLPTLATGSYGSTVVGTVPEKLLSPNLKPEIATSQEFGVDFNLFQNRLRFEGTYYYTENKNQLLDITTAAESGYTGQKVNAGLLASRGFELALGGSPIRDMNGWNLDVNLNFTRNRTKIKALTPTMEYYQLWDDNGGGAFTWVGEDIGNLYSRGYAKVEDKTSPYYQWPILNSSDGQWIESNDRTAREKVGNFNPDFMMGMQLSLSYKRFNLAASFDWRAGGQFQSYTYRYLESDWRSQRQIDNLIPGGQYSADELAALLKSDPAKYIIPQNGNFPRVGGHTKETGGFPYDGANDGAFIPGVIQNADGSYTEHLGGPGTVIAPITDTYPWGFNKQITFDASFIKLREISLGYSIPNIGPFRNATVSVFSRNIMLWTAAKVGIDPERAFQADGGKFRQGIELQNVLPWTMPVGFKVSFNL
ncbi:SusC/RagA family TonB-linked outer membrane protein [Dyadobacter sp. CY312]|uniref:SusC/RagA family TonB-linked outer membrane protein n=1 Tax=Dyadobacter sp. CY312 TaxID=2907303 RepID=UPI001F3E725F|nr:SusC/RagA family TonB-linked outer membrane protein [Dyadobacter sp. CY312]MCE7041901.1 SusC/RagA family TonB-linked outer membrane protein [Dyadobacter sp. CY312]